MYIRTTLSNLPTAIRSAARRYALTPARSLTAGLSRSLSIRPTTEAGFIKTPAFLLDLSAAVEYIQSMEPEPAALFLQRIGPKKGALVMEDNRMSTPFRIYVLEKLPQDYIAKMLDATE